MGNECIGCGCTEINACVNNDVPCHWLKLDEILGLGVCSSCPEAIEQLEQHQKEIAEAFSN